MTEPTPLDVAAAAMEAAPDDDDARLAFYARLVEGELFLMLQRDPEPGSDTVEPRIFPLDEGPFVLAYDREDRLARFAGGPTPYAAMAGRRAVEMLAGRGIGLGVNLGEAPSEMLLPAEAVEWLAGTVAQRPAEAVAQPREITPPDALPERLLRALDAKLARAEGLAEAAFLATVTYEGGARSHMLAFVGAAPGAEGALSRAAGEALTFSGLEAGTLDVAFLPADHILAARLARVALRFDLPRAAAPTSPRAPGTDPDTPPRLR
jgi:hypothetical protein